MKAYVIYDKTNKEYISGSNRTIFEASGGAKRSLAQLLGGYWFTSKGRTKDEFEVHEFELIKVN